MYIKRRNGFTGEKQIDVPPGIIEKHLKNKEFAGSLYITHIGFFPKAHFHYRERRKGCADNVLFYCLGGKGHYQLPTGNFELRTNQFAILPAGQPHRFQADLNDPWTIYWVHFSGDLLSGFNQFIRIENYTRPRDITYNEQIIHLWEEMYNSLNNCYDSRNIGFANLCLYHFLSLFVFPSKNPKYHNDEAIVTEGIKYLRENIQKSITVSEIAGHFNYSPSHFSALFKSQTGMSPIEYFIQLKVHHACKLLDQSQMKIKEISREIGYEDAFYFSRLFRKVIGVAPMEYRTRNSRAIPVSLVD